MYLCAQIIVCNYNMKESIKGNTLTRKPFFKPTIEIIEMVPCSLLAQSDDIVISTGTGTLGTSPGVSSTSMGWDD